MFFGIIFILLIPNTVPTPVLQGNKEKGNTKTVGEKLQAERPCLLPRPFKLNEGKKAGIEISIQNLMSVSPSVHTLRNTRVCTIGCL